MSPKKLQKTFILISFLGALIVLGFSFLGMSDALKKYNIASAQQSSINIGYTLFKLEQHVLIDETTDKLHSMIPFDLFEGFDRRMRKLLKPMGIVKIKIFSMDKKIIYSTDKNIIGQLDANNPQLNRALQGEVSSEFETKESIVDLNNELRLNVDVVETYLPMRDLEDQVVGVYEVYVDITPYRKNMNNTLNYQLIILAFLLFIIVSAVNFLMWLSTKKMTILQDKLQHQANHDTLTKIRNRAYLNERLSEELARVKRGESSGETYHSAIILIDIDHFKKFNDDYGHLVGDKILIAFSELFNSIMRQEDVAGRYGGEEFLAILPMTSPIKALSFAKRIHQKIKEKTFIIDGVTYQITVSIGVANLLSTDSSIDAVFSHADEALYHVKETGRDHVAQFQPEEQKYVALEL